VRSAPATARSYRTLMWLLVGIGVVSLGVAIHNASAGGALQPGLLALAIFFLCVVFAAWSGLAGARLVREERDRQNRREMMVFLAAELGRHDDETLRRIVRQRGPAGEAAHLLLKGRREKNR
jgi:cbb3-type cytochrome oxidase subunit 3